MLNQNDKPKAPEAEGLEPIVMGGGLARQYLQELFEIQRFCSSTNSTGSCEIRTEAFAWRRYCSIAEALGEPEEEFEEMIEKHKKEIAEIEAEAEKLES